MNPFDALTSEDKEIIKHYIQLYAGVSEPAPMEQILAVWNKQKRTLFKGFGGQLRVSIPVEIPRNDTYFMQELKSIYENYPIWDNQDVHYARGNTEALRDRVHNDFIFEFIKYIVGEDWEDEDYFHASRLFLHANIRAGYIETVDSACGYRFKGFNSTVKNGMRTMRTIQKMLKAMQFPRMDLFEEWRNRISDLNINKDIKANLVFSIHPIDFMTMSHNNCDWTSCMNWPDGSYSTGTIEMMNSNMAVVAYLESATPFNIIFDEKKFTIPNKSWRSLFYINKHIMVGGKAYPYANTNLTMVCLEELMKLFKKNLNWDYQYKIQPYRDVDNIRNNFYLKREHLRMFDRPMDAKKPKHAIYLYTNSMYNDLIEDREAIYYCCRNWVPRTMRFCVSGPATCMCCGEYMENPRYIDSYDKLGSEKVCYDCDVNKRCDICGEIKYYGINYTIKDSDHYRPQRICSDECLNNTIYFPQIDTVRSKDVLTDDPIHIILTDDASFFYKDRSTIHNFFNIFLRNKGNSSELDTIKDVLNDLFKNIYEIKTVPYFVATDVRLSMRKSNESDLIVIYRNFYFIHSGAKICGQNAKDYIKDKNEWIPAKEVLDEGSSSLSKG